MDPPKYDINFIQKHLWIPPSKCTKIRQRIYDLQRNFNVKICFNNNQTHNLTITGAPYKVEAACTRINIYLVDLPDSIVASSSSRNNVPRRIFDRRQRNFDDPYDSVSPAVIRPSELTLSSSNTNNPPESTSSKSTFVQPTFECSVCFENFSIDENFVTCSMNSVSEAASGNDKTHSMCLTCIKSYAHSSITGSSIAFGGIGLKCVEPECKNAFLLSTFEFYIDYTDYFPLQDRLQQQCIADANLEDLFTCSGCGLRMCVPTTVKHYICNCGRNNCRSCPRVFDGKHAEKTCKELDEEEANDVSLRNLESKMSEIVIRKCHKCGINFVKAEGCNKMECTCGATQCYICNKQGIKYDHFCACGNTNEQHGPCSICRKSCRIWENFEDLDNKKINEILSSADPLLEKNKQPQFNKIITPPENSRQRFALFELAPPIPPLPRGFEARRVIPPVPRQVVAAVAPPQMIPARPREIIPRRNDPIVPRAVPGINGLVHPQRNIYQQHQPQFTFQPLLPEHWHHIFAPRQVLPVPRQSVVPEQTVHPQSTDRQLFPVENLTYPPPPLPQDLHMMPMPQPQNVQHHGPVVLDNGQPVQQLHLNDQQAQPLPQQFYYPYYLINPYQQYGPYPNFNQFHPPQP